jgi:hypothetical protein
VQPGRKEAPVEEPEPPCRTSGSAEDSRSLPRTRAQDRQTAKTVNERVDEESLFIHAAQPRVPVG